MFKPLKTTLNDELKAIVHSTSLIAEFLQTFCHLFLKSSSCRIFFVRLKYVLSVIYQSQPWLLFLYLLSSSSISIYRAEYCIATEILSIMAINIHCSKTAAISQTSHHITSPCMSMLLFEFVSDNNITWLTRLLIFLHKRVLSYQIVIHFQFLFFISSFYWFSTLISACTCLSHHSSRSSISHAQFLEYFKHRLFTWSFILQICRQCSYHYTV